LFVGYTYCNLDLPRMMFYVPIVSFATWGIDDIFFCPGSTNIQQYPRPTIQILKLWRRSTTSRPPWRITCMACSGRIAATLGSWIVGRRPLYCNQAVHLARGSDGVQKVKTIG
jgi:hypothetical protein